MRKGETPKRCRPRDRDRKGRSKPLAASMIGDGREGGATVGATLNPQAGRPASTMTERADGVFRSRLACLSMSSVATHSILPSCTTAWDTSMSVSLHVCITCRAGETGAGETGADAAPRPGARLHAALVSAANLSDAAIKDVAIKSVECLSACSQGCAVALSAPGRWSYVYGRLSERDAPDILAGATAYARAPDGLVPWRERPVIFRKQSLARIPPIGD